MKKLRVGIIGGGRIGKVHAESITTRVGCAEIAALADPFMNDNLRTWAESMNIRRTTDDPMDIITDDTIDAVLICSPTNTHVHLITEAAKHGKHIFCEKPVDTDLKRIYECMDLVEKSGVTFQIGFNRRFDHNHMAVREQVENGKIGEPHIIKITSRDPAPPSMDYVKISGGIFLDMMIHDFDMVRYLSGAEVEEVYAAGSVLVDERIGECGDIDTAVVTLKLSNGAIGIIDNSRQAVYGYDQRTEVFGSGGCAMVDNDTPSLVRVSTADTVEMDKPLHFFLDRYLDSYAREIMCFIDTIRNGSPNRCGIIDAIRPVEIALACRKSLMENRSVRLDEIRKEADR